MKNGDALETKDAIGFAATVLDELYKGNVSNSRVQKVLFFAHLLSLKKYGKPLVKENFKAFPDEEI